MRSLYKRFLRSIAEFQVRHPYLTVLLILAVSLILYGGVAKVRTVASLEQMMPKDIEEIQAFNTLRDNYLGQDMIAIIIEIDRESSDEHGIMDIRDKEVMAFTAHLKSLIESEPDVREAYAASDVIAYAAARAGLPTAVDELSDEAYDQLLDHQQVQQQLSSFINHDATTSIIIATTDVSANDERMKRLASKVLTHLDSVGHPPGVRLKVTGTPIVQQKLGELIAQDRKNTQLISTIFVFLITMFLFGTFTSALVPLAVVTVSVNWLYGIMGYAGLPISTLAGGVAAMVIGIGIDYAIHLMNKFKNERKQGKTIQGAIVAAVMNTGTALTGAAVATTVAFLAFLFGSMPEMNRFGLLMAIGVSAAFLLSIFGLPALLIIEEKIIHSLKKRLRFGVEGEFVLYEKDEIHPDTHEVVDSLSYDELSSITKKYKVCKVKDHQVKRKKK